MTDDRADALYCCGRCRDAFPPEVMTCYELEPDARPVYVELCPQCMDEVVLS